MKSFDCDLQLHGKYASGVSKNLTIPLLASQAQKKGLEVLVTGDIQHREWLDHVKAELVEDMNGVYTDLDQRVHFIIGTEVEDQNRLHHLIYLPDLTRAEEFREAVKKHGVLDCSMCGRPKLRLSPAAIAQIVADLGGICGPAHAFTPYTGLFSKYDSVQEA
ncbi:MAG: phosphotransferase, partial [Candidatus Diapherotrites archaeon]|nr:phosphotransferase [Candidatus Diapherotrites archaeon]